VGAYFLPFCAFLEARSIPLTVFSDYTVLTPTCPISAQNSFGQKRRFWRVEKENSQKFVPLEKNANAALELPHHATHVES